MPTYQQPKYILKERERTTARKPRQRQHLSKKARYSAALPTIQEVLHRLSIGLQKLYTALHYHFHQLTAGRFSEMRLPWFKIALAAIAFFILTQKNIQFSINMKSPVSGFSDDREAENNAEQMSFAQPIALRSESSANPPAIPEHQIEAYVERFAKVAKAEQEKYGIPASLKLAQAIMESQAGLSDAAQHRHNHFGAPFDKRVFDSAWENWRAHSLLMIRYFPELSERQAPAASWLKAIQQSDLVQDKNYSARIKATIRQFNLDELD